MAENDLPGDDGTTVSESEEELVEDSLEEALEDADGTTGSDADEGGLDDSDYLNQIPEEHREAARQYSMKKGAELQSGWQSKLDDAADVRKKSEIVDSFNERFEKDPEGLIAELRRIAPDKPKGPADPGDAPDPVEDPAAWNAWYAADKVFTEWKADQKHERRTAQLSETVQGMQQDAQMQEYRGKIQALKNEFGFTAEQMQEVQAERQRIMKDGDYANWTVFERVRLRKAAGSKRARRAKQVEEAVQGEEERSGLPATGVHAKPPPTGNLIKDVLAEMKAKGEVPDGVFD